MVNILKELIEGILRLVFSEKLAHLNERPEVLKTLGLYKGEGFVGTFARIRFWDAPFIELERLIPKKGVVVDLGCGDGVFSNFLAVTGKSRRILGIELNHRRVKDGDRGLTNIKFVQGDVLKEEIPQADAIVMTHLLHHLPTRDDQERLIFKCYQSLKKNGVLVIAEVGEKPISKLIISYLTDAFLVPIVFERKLADFNFHYRRAGSWVRILKEMGFDVKVKWISIDKPFSHVIFLAKKVT